MKLERIITGKSIKPKIADIKIGDLVYFVCPERGIIHCFVTKIEIDKEQNRDCKVYGKWLLNQKNPYEKYGMRSFGFNRLGNIFKVIKWKLEITFTLILKDLKLVK